MGLCAASGEEKLRNNALDRELRKVSFNPIYRHQSFYRTNRKFRSFELKYIEIDTRQDNRKQEEIHKLLLLGAGQSGKSTVFKQMISLYGEGFPEAERKSYKTIINGNVVASMQVLIAQADLRAIEQKNPHYAVSDDLAQHKDIVMSAKVFYRSSYHQIIMILILRHDACILPGCHDLLRFSLTKER